MIGWIAGGVIVALGVLFLIGVTAVKQYKDPWHEKIADAGFVEKTAQIGDVALSYAEVPDNGPALLLLHAQHMDWYSYSRVLPELSKSFHVFAVSYHGHGKTVSPVERLYANEIGADLGTFIERVIGEPAYVSGNSSGGILTAWLAANRPELVRAIVLEDPSLFSSEYPRIMETIAYKSFMTCRRFVEEGTEDFLLYWLDSSTPFIQKQVGFNAVPLFKSVIQMYRRANPGEPVEISFLPDTLRPMIRGLDENDPHFGAHFYDGTWNRDFDHAEALQRIACPTLLIHANYEIQADGTLYGAMDQAEADRVISLIPGAEYLRMDAEHVTHLDKPEAFVEAASGFLGGLP